MKPARGGSSIGISKVHAYDDLDAALGEAPRHDPKGLVEPAVTGREIECGVLADDDGAPKASVPAEVRVSGGQDFYDFEAKYLTDATEFDIPPRLPHDVIERIRALAVQAFEAGKGASLAYWTPLGLMALTPRAASNAETLPNV